MGVRACFAESEVAEMEMVKKLEPLALLLLVIAALNWAIVSLFDTNVITEIFGTGTVTDVIYVLFGVSALVWIPRLMESFHLGHGPAPHGA
jgi:uncharacterized membrane protein YuzA (DUF378 family)